MNIAKNMEAFFVAAIAVAAFTTYATADVAPVAKPVVAQVQAPAKIATVVVSAKRLTAAEKARLGS